MRKSQKGSDMRPRRSTAVWLGKLMESGEHIIHDDGNIHFSRTINHRPEGE